MWRFLGRWLAEAWGGPRPRDVSPARGAFTRRVLRPGLAATAILSGHILAPASAGAHLDASSYYQGSPLLLSLDQAIGQLRNASAQTRQDYSSLSIFDISYKGITISRFDDGGSDLVREIWSMNWSDIDFSRVSSWRDTEASGFYIVGLSTRDNRIRHQVAADFRADLLYDTVDDTVEWRYTNENAARHVADLLVTVGGWLADAGGGACGPARAPSAVPAQGGRAVYLPWRPALSGGEISFDYTCSRLTSASDKQRFALRAVNNTSRRAAVCFDLALTGTDGEVGVIKGNHFIMEAGETMEELDHDALLQWQPFGGNVGVSGFRIDNLNVIHDALSMTTVNDMSMDMIDCHSYLARQSRLAASDIGESEGKTTESIDSSSQQAEPRYLASYGGWGLYAVSREEGEMCYLGSGPSRPKGGRAERRTRAALVARLPGDPAAEQVSLQSDRMHRSGSGVEVTVGGREFVLFTRGKHAWTRSGDDDEQLIEAMRRNSSMVVKGVSDDGSVSLDTYSLDGFAAAYDALRRGCGVEPSPPGWAAR
jgi:hypothetical protein